MFPFRLRTYLTYLLSYAHNLEGAFFQELANVLAERGLHTHAKKYFLKAMQHLEDNLEYLTFSHLQQSKVDYGKFN